MHDWVGLLLVHWFCCYDIIVPNAKCQRVLVLAVCLVSSAAVLQVFLRYYHSDELNAALQSSLVLVTRCQAYVRGLVARRRHWREVRRLTDETRATCDALQQLVVGVSSAHADVQQKLCREDTDRHAAEVCRATSFLCLCVWHSGRTLVFSRRTFPVLSLPSLK